MNVTKKMVKLIEEKKTEIVGLEGKVCEAKAYLSALEDSLKLISKHDDGSKGDALRPGSMVHQAREVLKKAGKPLHIGDLLKEMGKEATKENRVSLSGSLANYVRSQTIFTRPAPNTFGLAEFDSADSDADEPPDGFGGTEK